MTNGNDGICVSNLIQVGENEWRPASSESEYRNSISRKTTIGLTKRELMATELMASLLSNSTECDISTSHIKTELGVDKYEEKHYFIYMAKRAAMGVDALIAELNKAI